MKHKNVLALLLVCIAAGAAIYSRAQSTTSQLRQTAYLKASNTEAGDHFGSGGGALEGHAVAISGDGNTIAVGAPVESSGAKGINGNQNDNSVYRSGAVYVFTRGGNAWMQQAYVKASNPGQSDAFGFAVALSADGNTMAVAAPLESSGAKGINGNQNDDSVPQSGAVYLFTRTGSTWSQQAYVKASNTGEAPVEDLDTDGDQFGFSVALSDDGNMLAVGAIAEDSAATGINGNQNDNSARSAGAVYVFTRGGSTWSQQAYVKSSNLGAGDIFGYSVFLNADGSMMAVGASEEDGSTRQINGPRDDKLNGPGAVYMFTRTGNTWAETAYIKASNGELMDSFGTTVAVSDDGNTLAVSSLDEDCLLTGINPPQGCGDDSGVRNSTGIAYIFVRNGNTWTQQAYFKASNTGRYDWFGSRLALSGDGNTFAVGAQVEDSAAQGINGKQDDDSALEAGAVYLFRRNGTTWSQQAYVKGSNTEAFDEFGSAVSLSRDGRAMVVGAQYEDSGAKGVNGNQADNSALDAGAVYVFTY